MIISIQCEDDLPILYPTKFNVEICLLYIIISNTRGKLELNLRNLGFTSILHFKPSRDSDEEGEGQGSQELSMDTHGDGKPKSLKDRFREKVGEHCKDGAIVFIFVSGLQFPFEVSCYLFTLLLVTFCCSFNDLLTSFCLLISGETEREADFSWTCHG